MSTDTKWILGTIIPAILVVAGLLSAQISSSNAGIHTRIDDVHRRIDDLRSEMNRRLDDMQADIRELRTLVTDALKGSEPAD